MPPRRASPHTNPGNPQGFDVIDLVPDESYARAYLSAADTHGFLGHEQILPVAIVYPPKTEYHLPAVQTEMRTIQSRMMALPMARPDVSWSWIDDMLNLYLPSSTTFAYLVAPSADGTWLFVGTEDEFAAALAGFLADPSFSHHESDVAVAQEGGGRWTRQWIMCRELPTSDHQVDGKSRRRCRRRAVVAAVDNSAPSRPAPPRPPPTHPPSDGVHVPGRRRRGEEDVCFRARRTVSHIAGGGPPPAD